MSIQASDSSVLEGDSSRPNLNWPLESENIYALEKECDTRFALQYTYNNKNIV